MKWISAAELKAHLGTYLDMVREGKTLYVTSHRKPVAKISPGNPEEAIHITPPTKPEASLRDIQGLSIPDIPNVTKLLLGERRGR